MSRDTTTTTHQNTFNGNSIKLVGLDGLPDHYSRQSGFLSGSNSPLASPSPSSLSSPTSFNFSQPMPRQQRQWPVRGQSQVQARDTWSSGSFKRTSLEPVADEEPTPDPEPAAEQSKSPRFYASLPPSLTLSSTSIPTIDTESSHNGRFSRSSTSVYIQGTPSRNASTSRHSLYQPKPSSPIKTEVYYSNENNNNNNNRSSTVNRRPTRKLVKRNQPNPGYIENNTAPAPKKTSGSQNKSLFRALGRLLRTSESSS